MQDSLPIRWRKREKAAFSIKSSQQIHFLFPLLLPSFFTEPISCFRFGMWNWMVWLHWFPDLEKWSKEGIESRNASKSRVTSNKHSIALVQGVNTIRTVRLTWNLLSFFFSPSFLIYRSENGSSTRTQETMNERNIRSRSQSFLSLSLRQSHSKIRIFGGGRDGKCRNDQERGEHSHPLGHQLLRCLL